MGCRGCAGTAGYLLRDCGSVGPQPLPMSFCCAVMTQSPHILLKRRVQHEPAGKRLEGTKVAAFPRYCAPQKVQTGSAAAGGHQGVATRKATGDPATHGGAGDPECVKEQCVGTCDRCLEEGAAHKRCVTPPLRSQLRAAAAEQGTPTAQPFGVTVLFLGFGPSFKSSFGAPVTTVSGEDVGENFVVDRFSDHDRSRRLRE